MTNFRHSHWSDSINSPLETPPPYHHDNCHVSWLYIPSAGLITSKHAHPKNLGLMTLMTLNPGLEPYMWNVASNTIITRNGVSFVRSIPVTDVPSEKPSKWSTPMWAKNIIPNVVWTDGDIYVPAPVLLRLGYHRSVDAYYRLPTTRGLPQRSALG